MSEDSDKHLVFTIQAEAKKLKALFRKREDIEAIVKQSGSFQNCSSLTIYECFKFFASHIETFVPPSKNVGHVKTDNLLDPVIKIYLNLHKSQIKHVQDCISKIQMHIAGYLQLHSDEDATYQILEILFNFVTSRRNEFHEYLGSDLANFRPAKVCTYILTQKNIIACSVERLHILDDCFFIY